MLFVCFRLSPFVLSSVSVRRKISREFVMRDPLAAHSSTRTVASKVALFVLLMAGMLTPLIAVTQSRTFTPEEVASLADATATARPIPVAGVQIFMTYDAVNNIRRLQFSVDPQRIASVDQGQGQGLQPTAQGQVFDLVIAGPQFNALFEQLWNSSIQPVPFGTAQRIIIPYAVGEGGCTGSELPSLSCQISQYTTFRNGDSDPFDFVLYYAEILVDGSTATVVQRAANTGVSVSPGTGIAVLPGATASPIFVVRHAESEKDNNCTLQGTTLSCNPSNVPGVDRNNDSFYSDIIAIHDLVTHGTVYTKLKVGLTVYGFVNLCDAQPVMDVDGFGMVAGGGVNGVVAFTSSEFADAQAMPAGPAGGCSLPFRAGVQYNADGDAHDTAIRYNTIDNLVPSEFVGWRVVGCRQQSHLLRPEGEPVPRADRHAAADARHGHVWRSQQRLRRQRSRDSRLQFHQRDGRQPRLVHGGDAGRVTCRERHRRVRDA
jgi:hypothetical protein